MADTYRDEVISLDDKRLLRRLSNYASFMKLPIDVTFIFVAISGAVLAETDTKHLGVSVLLKICATTLLLSSGAETWTNIIDRNIDTVMPRTAKRPLPTGAITLKEASRLGVVLTALGFICASRLGVIPFIFFAFAFLDNVVIYSLLTKKTTPWSIVLGSPVAPLVLWAGYSSVAIPISLPAFLLGIMLMAWIPLHIWTIAIRYRQDYRKASVPMAPIVWGRLTLTIAVLFSGLLMACAAVASLVTITQLTFPHVLLISLVGMVSMGCVYLAFMGAWKAKIFASSLSVITLYLLLVMAIGIDFKL